MLRFFLLGEVGIKGFAGEGEGSCVRWMDEGIMQRRGPPDKEVCFGTLCLVPSRPYLRGMFGCSLAERPLPMSGTGRTVGAFAILAKLVLFEI